MFIRTIRGGNSGGSGTDLRGGTRRRARGVAAVEMACLLPFLGFVTMITIDYCRLWNATVEISNAARNGAIYGSDPAIQASSGSGSIQNAALSGITDLSPSPTVTSKTGTDTSGFGYVEVTVSYTFNTLVNYPGIPSTTALTRTVRMATAP